MNTFRNTVVRQGRVQTDRYFDNACDAWADVEHQLVNLRVQPKRDVIGTRVVTMKRAGSDWQIMDDLRFTQFSC